MLNKVESPGLSQPVNKPGDSRGYLFGQWPLLHTHGRALFLPVRRPDAIR